MNEIELGFIKMCDVSFFCDL